MSRMTKSSSRLRQASRRSSWRFSGSAGGVMLLIVTCLGIGAMYLAVSAKAANVGRQVLTLERRREELLHINAELTAAWSAQTSPERMMMLASELGFRPAGPQDVEYLTVEGYQTRSPFVAPRPPAGGDIGETALSPAYTETLGEWFARILGSGARR